MHGVYSMIVERAKNCHKFKRFEVKSSIQTSNFGGFRSTVQAKPHKNQVKVALFLNFLLTWGL